MKRIGIVLIISFLIVGHSFAQSKKNKKSKVATDHVIENDQIEIMEIDTYDEVTYHKNSSTSSCVGCAEKLSPSYLSTSDGYRYGYTNDHGQLIIPRIFSGAEYFSEGYAIVSMGGNSGTIDQSGTFIIPMKYSTLHKYKKNYYVASKGGYYGILTSDGKEVMPFIYSNISVEDENLLVIETNNKKGLYDFALKKWLIAPKYQRISIYTEYILCTNKTEDRMDWLNRATFAIIDSTYKSINRLDNGFFLVKKGNLYGIVNASNEIQVPVNYDNLERPYYSNNVLIGKKNNKCGILTYDNRILVEFIYDDIQIKNDLFIVLKNGKFGIIDNLTFKETTPCIYQDLKVFNSQRIFAQKNDLYGIIKYDGTVVEGFVYDLSFYTSNGNYRYIYKKGNKYGLIDENYSLTTDAIYDEISPLSSSYYDRYYFVIKGKEKFLLNTRGTILANVTEYDDIIVSGNKNFIVTKNKKYGLLDQTFNALALPIQYEMVSCDGKGACYVFDKGMYYRVSYDAENKPILTLVE